MTLTTNIYGRSVNCSMTDWKFLGKQVKNKMFVKQLYIMTNVMCD